MPNAADANLMRARVGSVWPPDVSAFLALVDEWFHDVSVPTIATVLDKGRLTLVTGKMWEQAPHVARVELLRHEASHVAHGCWMRRGEREPVLWNVATDAIIHGLQECDWALIDRECGAESVTLERLGTQLGRPLTLMPSERLYDLLVQAGGSKAEGCGSADHSKSDDSLESRLKASQIGRAVLGAPDRGQMRLVPPLPSVPAWIGEVLDWLVSRTVARAERVRSWRRAHRSLPDMLPGSARGEARAARFMLDASGSIGPDLLGELLAAVCSTPELAGSDVVVFDHVCREPIDVSDTHAVLESAKTAGGGTLIRAAGASRDPDKQTVWLTDGGTADGWPEGAEHDLWVVGKNEPYPKGAPHVVRA